MSFRFFNAGMSRVASSATTSLWSNAASTWSSNAGGVSTTTKSNCCLSRSSSFATSVAGIDSAVPGSIGATRVVQPGRVRSQQRHAPPAASRLSKSGDGVGDGVGREELERDGDVAEGQVEVDEADLAPAAVGQRGREVGGQCRLAAAALGGEDRDEPASGAVVLTGGQGTDGLAQLARRAPWRGAQRC